MAPATNMSNAPLVSPDSSPGIAEKANITAMTASIGITRIILMTVSFFLLIAHIIHKLTGNYTPFLKIGDIINGNAQYFSANIT